MHPTNSCTNVQIIYIHVYKYNKHIAGEFLERSPSKQRLQTKYRYEWTINVMLETRKMEF